MGPIGAGQTGTPNPTLPPLAVDLSTDITECVAYRTPMIFHTNKTVPSIRPFANLDSKDIVCRSPKIMTIIEGMPIEMILDSGAECSVLPKSLLITLFPERQFNLPTRKVNAFGGSMWSLQGPCSLDINVCGVQLNFPFYVLDADTPCIAGYDLIYTAQLVVDPVQHCVWSYRPTKPTAFTVHSSQPQSILTAADGPHQTAPATTDNGAFQHLGLQDNSATLLSNSESNSDSQRTISQDFIADGPTDSTLPKICKITLPDHLTELYETTVAENNLPTDTADALKTLLFEEQNAFARNKMDIGFCNLISHDIETGTARPIKQSPRRPPLSARQAEDDIIDDMLRHGIVEPSNSEWASPVCLVRKPDNSYRFCVDYRKLNAVTKKDAFPVPDQNDIFDSLQGASHFATIDLLQGYWEVPMTQRAKERAAFCTKRGLFQFTRLAYGLSNSPPTFCRLMSAVLSDLLYQICVSYIDDIIVFGRSAEELLDRLRIVLQRLQAVGLKAKPSKCVLLKTQIRFLGHLVSANGLTPLPERLDIIRNWPAPRCIREVRAFYGFCSYYRRFVKAFAHIAEPLNNLTKKNTKFHWSDDAQRSFDSLKTALLESTTLPFPRPDRPVYVDSDASDVAIGGVASQIIDGQERPIAFFSKVMSQAQRNYCTTRRELYAAIASLQHFRHYLLGADVILRTDHYSIKWLNSFKRPEGLLARWLETLAEYSITVVTRQGRLHSNADCLSRPFCKQCFNRPTKEDWFDELERADELAEPLGVRTVTVTSEISDTEIISLQQKDSALAPVCQFISNNISPTFDELRALPMDCRKLWAQIPQVKLQENVLVRCTDTATQLIVPAPLRRRLFQHAHAGPLAAHLGAARTLELLQRAYYWPAMRRDVTQWCKECVNCARAKGPPSRPHGFLQKIYTGEPMDLVAIDILSGLPATADGYKYILALTEYFTKWCEAYPLKDSEAATCATVLYNEFFSRFGFPRSLLSDQGPNFESRLFAELFKISGVNKVKTSSYHARGDGQTERCNRTILQMLRTSAQDHPESWPERLPALMSAYRMTVHSTTATTPNLAMLGRETLFPTTLIAKPPEEKHKVTVPYVTKFQDNMREAHERIRSATRATARVQKSYFDKGVRPTTFAVGDLTWLYWPRPLPRSKYKKLTPLWTGPFKILKFQSAVVVIIQHVKSLKKQTVHVDRLVKCNTALGDLPSLVPSKSVMTSAPKNLAPPDTHPSLIQHQSADLPQSQTPSCIVTPGRPQRRRKVPARLQD